MRLTTYDSALILNAGPQGCSVVAAPPTLARRSSTVTRAPCFASRPAATRPLWPPPTTMTWNGSLMLSALRGRSGHTRCAHSCGGEANERRSPGDVGQQRPPRFEARAERVRILGAFVGPAQVEDRGEV